MWFKFPNVKDKLKMLHSYGQLGEQNRESLNYIHNDTWDVCPFIASVKVTMLGTYFKLCQWMQQYTVITVTPEHWVANDTAVAT
jgi:hypothetical protein